MLQNQRYLTCISIFLTGALHAVLGLSNEGVIVKKILKDYSVDTRPVKSANMPVNVQLTVRLNTLLGLDTKEESLETILLLTLVWEDERLKWNLKDYNLTSIVDIPVGKLWIPDIVLFNSAEESLSSSTEDVKTKVSVNASGTCTLFAPLKYKSKCNMNVKNFPYDKQRCAMRFGSWTLDKTRLVIKNAIAAQQQTDLSSGQWLVKKIHSTAEEVKYSCCQHEFSQIRLTFDFERKPLYFLLYLILPCVLVSLLILLVFIIPPSSGERLGLGITIILNMSVYLLVVSDNLPQSSDQSPLLGVFYVVMIYEMTIAFVLSGLTLWISNWTTDLPNLVSKMFFKWPTKENLRRITKIKQFRDKDMNTAVAPTTITHIESEDWEEGKESINLPEIRKQPVKPAIFGTWQEVGRKLDKIFFIFFLVLFLLTTFATVYVRPDVSHGSIKLGSFGS